MKKIIFTAMLATCFLNSSELIIDDNIRGVLLEEIKNKELKIESQIASIKLEIDLAKKDTLAKIERDAAKELADFTERKNDLSFFKDKYKSNMYAKSALSRIKQEEKDLIFMHEKYVKNKTEKIKQLMDDNYIPDDVLKKGNQLLELKKKSEKIKTTLKYNIEQYNDTIKKAKDTLKKANELLLKEIEIKF